MRLQREYEEEQELQRILTWFCFIVLLQNWSHSLLHNISHFSSKNNNSTW